jgi:ornithine cyclodeaminase
MTIIEKEDVLRILTPEKCVALMREAFIGLETGKNGQPLRNIAIMPNGAKFGFMPAFIGDQYFGAKVITAQSKNQGTKYPTHMGYVMLCDQEYGSFIAAVEASSITEIRTGAASAVATDELARKDAAKMAVIGAGAQARSHVAAISAVRKLEEIFVYDVSTENAIRFKDWIKERFDVRVTVSRSAAGAVANADIICALTPETKPFLSLDMVKPGVHINAVGAFMSTARELASDLVAASKLYADQIEAVLHESGDYLFPLNEGAISEGHLLGSIGQIAAGVVSGRTSENDITIFEALGLAVEDVASAAFVYEIYKKEQEGNHAPNS